jgi:hypothetical protein
MKTLKCPFIKKACMEHECMLFTHVQMTDPQTGKDRDEWACSLALIPVMVVEGARVTRGVQAAVESTRNEIIQRQDTLNRLVVATSQAQMQQIIDAGPANPRLSDETAT